VRLLRSSGMVRSAEENSSARVKKFFGCFPFGENFFSQKPNLHEKYFPYIIWELRVSGGERIKCFIRCDYVD
jgi:hypothetical protein